MNGYHIDLCYGPDVEKLQRRKIQGIKVWLVDNSRGKGFCVFQGIGNFQILSDYQIFSSNYIRQIA